MVEPQSDNPYEVEEAPVVVVHTWITLEELQAAEEKKLRDLMIKEAWGDCQPGDPLCTPVKDAEAKP